jgi:GPI-anchor transamidase subunit K
MKDLFDSYDRNLIHSTPGVRTDLFRRRLDEVKITDFFGNVQSVEIGGQDDIIDEDLLGQQKLTFQPSLGNDTVLITKKDTLDVGSPGFEVKLQDGNVWVKCVAVIACIILWIIARQL